jgi:hypothetical protein
MQFRTTIVLLLLCFMFFANGCATLIRGNAQNVRFQTDPAQATINVDGVEHATPFAMKLKRNETHKVLVTAPGYEPITFALNAQWDGVSLGNILMPGGSVGFGVDTLDGADRSFNRLAKITLNKCAQPISCPVQMYEHKGKILTKRDYDREMQEQLEYHADCSGY